jgi:hypothetical protein
MIENPIPFSAPAVDLEIDPTVKNPMAKWPFKKADQQQAVDDLLRLVDDLVVSWVDDGEPHIRVEARKKLESAIRAFLSNKVEQQPVHRGDHDFSVDLVERIRTACTRMGIATSPSLEECSFKLESMLYELCRAVEKTYSKLLTQSLLRGADDVQEGWRAMVYAPLDGTEVELLLHHPNRCYAKGEEKKIWESVVKAKWIDINDGGWTWTGMFGRPMGWRLPAPPVDAATEVKNG